MRPLPLVDDRALASLGRQTSFFVDLDILEKNLADMRAIIGPGVRLAAVIKADAYGHGALPVARLLAEKGVDILAVATLSEGIELRKALPQTEILVMGHTPGYLMPLAVRDHLDLTIFDLESARILSSLAPKDRNAHVHIKLDTGMNRLGIKAYEKPAELIAEIAALPGIEIRGVFTHLALRNRESDMEQFALFERILKELERLGVDPGLRHICDSIGTVRYPEFRMDMVRVGAALFGVRPFRMGPEYDAYHFPQVGSFLTRIARLRFISEGEMVSYDDSWKAPPGGSLIATLPVGYADGYPRQFANKGYVLIRGKKAPVVGLVCMDQLMVDASGIEGAREGDEVLLFGGQGIDLAEASSWASLNRNALLCGIGKRVPRIYKRNDRLVEPGAASAGAEVS
ncbi:MAG TPA: alanine racemase [Rectinemataceae bacterium]